MQFTPSSYWTYDPRPAHCRDFPELQWLLLPTDCIIYQKEFCSVVLWKDQPDIQLIGDYHTQGQISYDIFHALANGFGNNHLLRPPSNPASWIHTKRRACMEPPYCPAPSKRLPTMTTRAMAFGCRPDLTGSQEKRNKNMKPRNNDFGPRSRMFLSYIGPRIILQ